MAEFLLVLAIAIVIVIALFAILLARKAQRRAANQRVPVPGSTATVPPEWAGSHSPEAKLHRRLVAASHSIKALPLTDAAAIEQAAMLQQHIIHIDDQLIATTAVGKSVKASLLPEFESLVDSIELTAAALAAPTIDIAWLTQSQAELDQQIRGRLLPGSST